MSLPAATANPSSEFAAQIGGGVWREISLLATVLPADLPPAHCGCGCLSSTGVVGREKGRFLDRGEGRGSITTPFPKNSLLWACAEVSSVQH